MLELITLWRREHESRQARLQYRPSVLEKHESPPRQSDSQAIQGGAGNESAGTQPTPASFSYKKKKKKS